MPRKVYRATVEIRLPGEKHTITVDGIEGDTDQTLAAALMQALRHFTGTDDETQKGGE